MLIFNLKSDQTLQKCFKKEFNGISNLVWCGLKKIYVFVHTATFEFLQIYESSKNLLIFMFGFFFFTVK